MVREDYTHVVGLASSAKQGKDSQYPHKIARQHAKYGWEGVTTPNGGLDDHDHCQVEISGACMLGAGDALMRRSGPLGLALRCLSSYLNSEFPEITILSHKS